MKKSRFLLLSSFLLFAVTLSAQPSKLPVDSTAELTVSEESKVHYPERFEKGKKYPLVIFLPATGWSGGDYFNYIANDAYIGFEGKHDQKSQVDVIALALFGEKAKEMAFIGLTPAGTGSTKDHTWKGFNAFVTRYEKKLNEDIDRLIVSGEVDENKIILVGYSLGGDLAWALTQRYPKRFRGAIISGSRCGLREKGVGTELLASGTRFFLHMGDKESDARLKGVNAAIDFLKKNDIPYKYSRMFGEHVPSTFSQLREALTEIFSLE